MLGRMKHPGYMQNLPADYCVILHRKLNLHTESNSKYTMSYISNDSMSDVSHPAVQVNIVS